MFQQTKGKRILSIVLTLLIVFGMVQWNDLKVYATATAVDLITNGSANGGLNGWTFPEGVSNWNAWESGYFVGETSPCDADAGTDAYFDYNNTSDKTTSMYQDIPITGLSDQINAGNIMANLSMYNYGYDVSDKVTLTLSFYNDTTFLSDYTIQPGYVSGWDLKTASCTVPANTNRIQVKIDEQVNVGYVAIDGISLKLSDNTPSVLTNLATNIKENGASIYVNIINLGNATEYGFCYGETSNPTIADNKKSGFNPSVYYFSQELTDLSPNTTYYVRSYIRGSSGNYYYGNQISFTTLKKTAPTLNANSSDNSVDNNIEITFTPDSDFEGKITGITYNHVGLAKNTDYTVGSGVITLKPSGGNSALTTAGTHGLEITATGYTAATVNQTIMAGAVHDLTVTTQPAPGVSGAAFSTQPKVTLKDQYGNVCADGVSATASVTAAAKAGTGSYTLGGTLSKPAINGVVSFTDLTCSTNTVGTAAITFSSGSSIKIDSDTFTLPKRSGLATTETPTIAVPCQLSSEYTKTIDLADVIKLNQTDTENISYSDSAITNTANIIKADSINLSGSTLTFVLNPAISTGTSSIIPITVTTDNYTDITVNLEVSNTINRITPALSGTITTGNITYGDMLSAASLTATFINTNTSAEVPGTISWDSPSTIPNAGSYTANWTFTPTDTYTYQSITGTANVTVFKRAIILTPDHATFSKTYGNADPTITYQITQGTLVGTDTLTTPLTYIGTNAGTYDIVANTALNTNYNITIANGTNAFIITKRPLTIQGIVTIPKTYDGTTNFPSSYFNASFTGMAGSDTITYTAAAPPCASANAGAYNTNVTVTLTGISDTNYSLTINSIDATEFITKTTTTAVAPPAINVIAGQERSYSFDASTIALENVTAPKSTGSCSYSVEPATPNSNFTVQPYMSDTNIVSFTTASNNVASVTPIGSFTVRVSSQNYNDILVPVNVIAVDKTTLSVSGVSVTDKDYDGTVISANGTPVFKDGTTVVNVATPVYRYTSTDGAGYDSEQAPINAGAYKLTISVPDSNMDYMGSVDIPFAINKVPLTITADPQTITVGDDMPTAYTLSYSGFISGETQATPGVFTVSPVASCPSGNSNIATSYDIIINTPAAANYAITTVSGTLTVQSKQADSSFYTINKTPNANGWYNSDVTIIPTGKDGFNKFRIIGIMNGLTDVTFLGETANSSYNISFEKGSAITEPITFTYKLDKTAPVLDKINYNPAVSFVRDIYNFLTGSISINVQVSDNLSGVNTVNYELIPDTNGGTAKTGTATVNGSGIAVVSVSDDFAGLIRFSASDLAGNQAATITSNFVTEDTAPDISFATAGTDSNGWYNSDVTLDAIVRDNAANAISGGIKQITYQSGSNSTDYIPSTIVYDDTKQYTLTADGSYTYRVSATDNSGNTSSKDITINIDKTAPVISTVQSVPIDATKLYKGYHLTIAATDATGSGIAGYSVDGGTSWQTGNEFTLNQSKNITASDIKVKDTAGNVTTYAGSDISITVPKVSTVTTLTLDSSNAINYGSSVNLTATVTKDSDISQTIGGTISFYINNGSGYVKIGDSVLASDGKATFTVSKGGYQNIGAKSFYASYSGNSIFDSSNSNTETITVTPKRLTVKAEDITCFSGNTLPGTKITYSGFVEGENETNTSIGNAITAVHTAMDTNTAGSYAIRVLVGTFATAPNYTITLADGILTIKNPSTDATMTGLVTTPVAGAPSAILAGATLPPGISAGDIRLLVSTLPAADRTAIMQASAGAMQQIPSGNTLFYEISLVDIANGNAVVQPGGGINITLPYPSGTDSNTSFGIVHLIGGVTPENLACTNTAQGVSFVTQSLSPFIIGYNTNGNTNNNSSSNTNNNNSSNTNNNSSTNTENNSSTNTDNSSSNTTTAPSTATTTATVASTSKTNKAASKSSSDTSIAEDESVQNEEAIQTEPDNTATVTDNTTGTVEEDSNNKDTASGDNVKENKADSNSSLIFIIAAIALTALALLVFFIITRRRKKEEDTEEQNKSDIK